MLWDKWSRKLLCPVSGLHPCLEVTSAGEQRCLWWSCRDAKKSREGGQAACDPAGLCSADGGCHQDLMECHVSQEQLFDTRVWEPQMHNKPCPPSVPSACAPTATTGLVLCLGAGGLAGVSWCCCAIARLAQLAARHAVQPRGLLFGHCSTNPDLEASLAHPVSGPGLTSRGTLSCQALPFQPLYK